MKASQWIDLVKSYREWGSDYRAAKELGLSRNTISMYRTRTPTMDEETAVVVADALEINPATVVLDQVVERSKSETVREALADCIMGPDDVLPPGYTAVERKLIREDIERLGVGALDPELARRTRTKHKPAEITGWVLVALLGSISLVAPQNAEAAHTDKQEYTRLYIM